MVEKVEFYQASTSGCFGNSIEAPQNERTPIPRVHMQQQSYSYWITVNYRGLWNICQ